MPDTMREATAAEYGQATATPHAAKRIMEGTRCQDVEWTHCGRPLAWKTTVWKTKRKTGTPASVTYQVNPAFLEPTAAKG